MTSWHRAAFIGALAVSLTSCSKAPVDAPFGLESIQMPEGSDQVAAVLADLPSTLQGLEANAPEGAGPRWTRTYGSDADLAIAAVDWSAGGGDFMPQTAGEFLPRFVESGEIDIAESDLEGEPLWLIGENHELNEQGDVLRTFWTMWWGAPDSGWVFAVNAPSEEDGIALVEAFVEAASSSG